MKRLAIFAALVATLDAQEPFTYETADSLFSTGDFNGDGRTDLVIVDKQVGTFTVGFAHAVDDSFDWSPQHPSRFASPTGLAAGTVEGGLGVLTIAAPDENRLTLFALPSPALGSPLSGHLFPSQPAPHSIAGFDIYASTSTDYLIVGESGTAGAPYYLEAVSLAPTPPTLYTSNSADRSHRVWRVLPEAGGPPHAVVARGSELRLIGVGAGALLDISPLSAYTASDSTRLAYGFFGANTSAHIVAYELSQTTGTVARIDDDPLFGAFKIFGPPSTLTFPKPLVLITTVNGRLAALFTDGTAATYDFDGATLAHRSDLPGTHDLLAPIEDDSFLSLQGGAWQRWDASSSAATLTPVTGGPFPALGTAGNAATVSNIVFADAEPFVDPTAKALFFGHVRDWTITATGMDRDWDVTSLSQTTTGLDAPTTSPVDPDDDDADHALVNQIASNISFRLLESTAYGKPVGDVRISPSAGRYLPLVDPDKHTIRITTDLPGATIYYRYAPTNAWFAYNPINPPAIPPGSSSATIETYAENTESRTPTRRAAYTFADPVALTIGSLIDSDGDGMPDQWEDAFNAYDPFGDADGDGVNNLTEFQNCTDPHDASSIFPVDLVLEATFVGSDTLRLEWSLGLPEATLQSSLDLNEWEAITSGIGTVPGRYRLDVPRDIRRFYRLVR